MRTAALLLAPLLLLPAAPADAADLPVVLGACARPGSASYPPQDAVLLGPGGARGATVARGTFDDPAVSPDGRFVAYTGLVEKSRHVLVTEVATRVTRQLTRTGMWAEPSWSPDGRTLVVSDANGGRELGLVDATTDTDPTRPLPEVRRVPGTVRGSGASWSPDGAYLVYSGAQGLIVVQPDGRGSTPLGVHGGGADWSPDGHGIAYGADSGIDVVALPSLAVRHVLRSAGYRAGYGDPAWSPDGTQLYATLSQDYTDPEDPTKPAAMPTSVVRIAATAQDRYDSDPAFRAPAGTSCPSAGGGTAPADDATPPAPTTSLDLVPAPSRITVRAGLDAADAPAGVLVRYAPGPVAPLTPSDGLDGGRGLLGSVDLVRLPPSSTYSVTVFPVDWSGRTGPGRSATTTTPAEVATSLTSELPATVGNQAGAPVDLSAVLRREDDGSPLSGATVDLLAHHEGQPDALVTRLTTDAQGRVTSRREPVVPTRYTLRYAGSGPLQPASAGTLASVFPQVTATLSRTTVSRGGAASLLLVVRPARPGLNVRVTERVGSRVLQTPLVRLDRTSRVRVALRTGTSGRHELEVQTGSNTDLDPGYAAAPPLSVR